MEVGGWSSGEDDEDSGLVVLWRQPPPRTAPAAYGDELPGGQLCSVPKHSVSGPYQAAVDRKARQAARSSTNDAGGSGSSESSDEGDETDTDCSSTGDEGLSGGEESTLAEDGVTISEAMLQGLDRSLKDRQSPRGYSSGRRRRRQPRQNSGGQATTGKLEKHRRAMSLSAYDWEHLSREDVAGMGDGVKVATCRELLDPCVLDGDVSRATAKLLRHVERLECLRAQARTT